MTELHVKYAPILRFNKDEQFFPMPVEAMLGYSGLYVKGQAEPVIPAGQVTPDLLRQAKYRGPNTFLRSVAAGPLTGQEVVDTWEQGVLEMIYRALAARPDKLAENLARKAYSWFSPKTRGATELFWWNTLIVDVLSGTLKSVPVDKLPRLILTSETRASAAGRYQQGSGSAARSPQLRAPGRSPIRRAERPPFTYYYRQMVDSGYLCLQYWFFYSYNDWGNGFGGLNDHEGDWEGMMLFFPLDQNGRPQEPPAYVTFADHGSRQTKPWEHKDVTRIGTHPVGFVGAGSHATYPEATVHILMAAYNLFDFARGDGLTIDHDDWQQRINLDELTWLADYAGSWGTRFWLPTESARKKLTLLLAATPFGPLLHAAMPAEIELPGVSAPRGPVGLQRPQYASPAAWAGVPVD
jgi:hypothetical protein